MRRFRIGNRYFTFSAFHISTVLSISSWILQGLVSDFSMSILYWIAKRISVLSSRDTVQTASGPCERATNDATQPPRGMSSRIFDHCCVEYSYDNKSSLWSFNLLIASPPLIFWLCEIFCLCESLSEEKGGGYEEYLFVFKPCSQRPLEDE